MWLAFVPGFLRGSLYPWNFLTVVSLLLMSPSDHTWVYAMKWDDSGWRPVTRKINRMIRALGFKTGGPPGRRRGGLETVQSGTNDSVSHAYGKESPKKTSRYQISAVSCLTNTNVLGGWCTPISWKEGTELCIWDHSRPPSVSSFGWS